MIIVLACSVHICVLLPTCSERCLTTCVYAYSFRRTTLRSTRGASRPARVRRHSSPTSHASSLLYSADLCRNSSHCASSNTTYYHSLLQQSCFSHILYCMSDSMDARNRDHFTELLVYQCLKLYPTSVSKLNVFMLAI